MEMDPELELPVALSPTSEAIWCPSEPSVTDSVPSVEGNFPAPSPELEVELDSILADDL